MRKITKKRRKLINFLNQLKLVHCLINLLSEILPYKPIELRGRQEIRNKIIRRVLKVIEEAVVFVLLRRGHFHVADICSPKFQFN